MVLSTKIPRAARSVARRSLGLVIHSVVTGFKPFFSEEEDFQWNKKISTLNLSGNKRGFSEPICPAREDFLKDHETN